MKISWDSVNNKFSLNRPFKKYFFFNWERFSRYSEKNEN